MFDIKHYTIINKNQPYIIKIIKSIGATIFTYNKIVILLPIKL